MDQQNGLRHEAGAWMTLAMLAQEIGEPKQVVGFALRRAGLAYKAWRHGRRRLLPTSSAEEAGLLALRWEGVPRKPGAVKANLLVNSARVAEVAAAMDLTELRNEVASISDMDQRVAWLAQTARGFPASWCAEVVGVSLDEYLAALARHRQVDQA